MSERVTLQVEGMTCTGCEQRLGTALGRVDGVREASADHDRGEVAVRFDPDETTRGDLVERIERAGFEVVEPTDAGASR